MNTSSASTTSARTKKSTKDSRKAEPVVKAPAGVLDVLAGVVLLGVFGLYVWHAMQLPGPMNPNGIGVGEFPVIIAFASLVAVALMLCLGVIKCFRRSAQQVVTTCRPLSVLLAVLVLVGIGTYLGRLGPIVGVAALSVLTMLVVGERRPMQVIAVSLGLSLGLYAVFILALGVSFS
ncbi:tripartite tricarboxylate transporter TctB family protein [Pseudomonas fluorescens]|uniref:Tripartite tricarboxylate transporter TctB family protein n=1 Tax=Pseudomonas fluorescens TaxID=294 RepID=A0A944E444_PSEFL|nr:tripartite tricarboxylate transporter TctB family protein [Pseudomonas fluorescens]MBT2295325.1 tripartite tricarboxylate transporter TctB family protein [Pseudomonas fluorescens]MBT2308995.1 tripartite tricarboxylate transporter TctB family protein [Pseudomonas fluorescens]MBT2312252.1 tripartite tricarboxylate transporter TctB family protein [Pseudomonas fluorescens]MBT2318181.1 tripartite tricarboxylate transporter TctB family protein [Pseudomonas fluorescens]MBT2332016.1 tripartite tric